ncbi:MAG: hypothetical protein GTN64_03940, partial [Candidatus Latescibacteria bacterium]|nr:hypothetical protein [Candidatus Latescibacterota bacterium]NIO77762.1 hypothetical protein [Candidatus Latescibacterota bacterium]
ALEVDWDYDGQLFHSEAQSVRDWQQDAFEAEIGYTYPKAGQYTVAAFVIDAEGQSGLATQSFTIG